MSTVSFTLHHPFCFIAAGPSGSGKTFAISELLQRRNEVIDPPVNNIVFVYSVFQPIYYKLQAAIPTIKFTQNLHDIETLATRGSLVIVDDHMTEIEKGPSHKLVTDYFTKYCHHMGVSSLLRVHRRVINNLCADRSDKSIFMHAKSHLSFLLTGLNDYSSTASFQQVLARNKPPSAVHFTHGHSS